MRLLFVSLLLIYTVGASSQTNIHWQKIFGGSDFELTQAVNRTADGGSIIAGTSYSTDGDIPMNKGVCDVLIAKLSSDGTIEWKRNYGGSDEDGAYSIEQTMDGGYVFCGYTKSNDGDVHDQHGIADCWVVKLDATGNLQWQKALGGTEYDVALSIKQTADQGFIMAGYTISKNGDITNKIGGDANQDAWLVKLNANGNKQWQKTYGGTHHEIPYKVIIANNRFVVACMSQSTNGHLTNNKGQRDVWVFSTDLNGTFQWQHNYGGSGNDFPYDIIYTKDGGYLVTGSTSSNDVDMLGNHGQVDAFAIKLDENGLLQWSKCYGGSSLETLKFIHQNDDGSYLLAGSTESKDIPGLIPYGKSDYWLMGISATGTMQWQQHFGGTDIDDLHAACINNGSLILAGTSFSNDHDVTNSKAGGDYWIVNLKLNTPVITTQPISKEICASQNINFGLVANNATAYQWQVLTNNAWQDIIDNNVFTGTSTNALSINNITGLDQVRFRCKVSNAHSHVFSNEVSLSVLQSPAITVHPKDTKTCSNTIIELFSQANNSNRLEWQRLSQNTWVDVPNANSERLPLTPAYNGTNPQYRLKASNTCATVFSNPATVTVANCQVPNAFSPNADGTNDTWNIPFLQQFTNNSVQVFNRNGQKVFEARNGYKNNWNGMLNGSPLPVGVYYYIVLVGETKQQLSGPLMLVR